MKHSGADIEMVTRRIERAIRDLIASVSREPFWVTHYGANDIDPGHLVYWICVETDTERDRLANHRELNQNLRRLLTEYGYPVEGRDGASIGFESQETVDREFGGNWRHHWQ
ncbi:MAG TPA: hypothetical protein PK014_14095 [Thermoanaerobaculia bacterium]|nr:hypothetical protein [Thermoanaerobaculia bacterium]HUM31195.1 hypothetical protein [Thermoanaerobaculia bacterium]HXK69569.1 hypothetical protein [Thermoanaerobaculia bacterium]